MIFPCEIKNIPVVVKFNPSNNYNITDIALARHFKLKIDTSYTEPEGKPSMLHILGMIHKLNIHLKTKDNKRKQVKVTEIFVNIEPEPEDERALILGWPWFEANVAKPDIENKTFTLHNGVVIPYHSNDVIDYDVI